ncbi:ATP-binding protein, partial [Streptomyces sp. AJS327]|uniref:ATP-binding protein n=1 Tax=Streptomyces sp. AJS327 TaxID=2545265 RepID=UPI0027E50F91
FEVACAPDRSYVGHLRQVTAGYLGLWDVHGSVADNIVLAVSELVSNSVLHGKGGISLRIRYAAPDLRVDVTDANPTPAELRNAGDDEDSGRGMFLVAVFSRAWGVSKDGRTTWCRFRVPTGRP